VAVQSEWGRIEELTIVPYPPVMPGNITVSATVHLTRAFEGNITAKVDIRRDLFWGLTLPIPCINNIGTW
jgi:hypothetical protein